MLIAPNTAQNGQAVPKGLLIFMFLLYPLIGAAMGWVTGQLGCRIYNWAARRYGGLLVEVAPVDNSAT